MTKRLEKVRKKIAEFRTDAFLVVNHEQSGQPGRRYLSGFSGSESMLLVTNREAFLITDGRYFSQAAKEAGKTNLVHVESGRSYRATFENLAADLKIESALLDGTRTSHTSVEWLHSKLNRVVSHPNLLQELRIIKDAEEIILLKRAVQISVRALKKLLPHIRPGVRETALAARLEFLMKTEGADKPAFETIVASGHRGALPHAQPTSKKLKKGELVTIDFGASYRGYTSDIARTVALGNIPSKLKEVYEAVRGAQELGCAAACAGVTGKAIDNICRNHIETRGYGKYFLHSTGHGVGMEVHELPIIAPSYDKKLPAGSVITCEPGIYIHGLCGVRIEDTLALTESGSINLSGGLSKKLLMLEIL